jgi:hypothetical protein
MTSKKHKAHKLFNWSAEDIELDEIITVSLSDFTGVSDDGYHLCVAL